MQERKQSVAPQEGVGDSERQPQEKSSTDRTAGGLLSPTDCQPQGGQQSLQVSQVAAGSEEIRK